MSFTFICVPKDRPEKVSFQKQRQKGDRNLLNFPVGKAWNHFPSTIQKAQEWVQKQNDPLQQNPDN